jgi:hypothetical protein
MDDRQPATRTLDAASVRAALLFVFVGLLVAFLDVTIAVGGPGEAHAIDVLNDVIGYGLIAWGQLRLMGQPGPPTYGATIRVALVVTLIGLVWSLVVQIALQGAFGTLPTLAFTFLDLAGWLVFIVAMRELSRSNGLTASSAYWDLTFKVASAMWGALAILLVVIVAILLGPGFGSLGWLRAIALLGLPLALVPVLHVGSSLLRLRQELGRPSPEAPRRRIELIVGTIVIAVVALVFFALGFAGGPI